MWPSLFGYSAAVLVKLQEEEVRPLPCNTATGRFHRIEVQLLPEDGESDVLDKENDGVLSD